MYFCRKFCESPWVGRVTGTKQLFCHSQKTQNTCMCFSNPHTKPQHTIKDQWFEHSIVQTEWTDLARLWYGTLVRFLCSEMIDERLLYIVYSYLRIWPYAHFGLTREATRYAALVETRFFPPWSNYIMSDSNNNVTCNYSRLVL